MNKTELIMVLKQHRSAPAILTYFSKMPIPIAE